MSGTLYADNFHGKLMMHDTTYSDDLTITENYSALLVGPITVSGNLTVPTTSNLTVFNSISITGDVDVTGTLDIR